ncbi:transposable element Tcb2 transposase [Trichonephila clavipes]|uniref:Transposable element Tcb2 transposase n=1 Tax=Trichonephila clavipes TaxID=2585209 RepID=A0A8X6W9K1_TRICX|nr:transposable element Tcb2 transposase [Trichonephila clavipes]
MTTQRYVHDIQQPHVLPLMQGLPGAIVQQDKARPHTARVSQDCLCTIITLPWTARCPDLFQIEHIWGHFGMTSRPSHEFERTRGKVTANMERNVSRHHTELVSSMPDRIALRIRAEGFQQGIKSTVLLFFSLIFSNHLFISK